MASEADLIQFQRLRNSADLDVASKLVENLPAFPESFKRRFPELRDHELKQKEWTRKLIRAIRGGEGETTIINQP